MSWLHRRCKCRNKLVQANDPLVRFPRKMTFPLQKSDRRIAATIFGVTRLLLAGGGILPSEVQHVA
jgi:hypothetical protein